MPTRKAPADGEEGYLTPEEFEQYGKALLGGWGWQRKWCRGTGMAPSTINRYLTGQYPVPKHVAMLVKTLVMLHSAGIPLPDEFFEGQREGDVTADTGPED